jgi:hypothetical protein
LGNGFAGFDISRATHEDWLEGVGLLEIADNRGKGSGVPAFGGSVCGAREDGEVRLGGGVFWFGESGGWGKFSFAFGKAEIFQEAEILIGDMDIVVGEGSVRTMIRKKEITDRA